MASSLLLLVMALLGPVAFADDECHRSPSAQYYQELGCIPRFEKESKCPTSYDCTNHEQKDKSKCHHKGVVYNVGDQIEVDECLAGCFCAEGYGPEASASITCANVECGSHFGEQPDPECYFAYDRKSCCSTKTICPSKEPTPPATCQYNNATYHVGEKFYPSDQPCKACICGDNFQGRLEEPFCEDIKCNPEVHSQSRITDGCVPVFYGADDCCPIDWRCPSDEDKVVVAKTKDRSTTTQTCKFGKLTLQPGDILEESKNNPNVDCLCRLPPYLTCISRPQQ